MTRRLSLGFMTHVHGVGVEAGALYRELVELFVAADELGYDSGWVAQHHLQVDHNRLPSPLVLLAAAAERTRRIHLGTSVVVLPLEDPLRLAEDAAVLEALSGGRFELGIGSGGFSAGEFAAFGRDTAQRHALFDDHLARLLSALEGARLSAGGERLAPSAPNLTQRLWDSTTRPEAVAAGARAGRGLLLGVGPAAPFQRALADAYLAALPPGSAPRLAAVRGIFPGPDRATPTRALAPDVARYLEHHVRAGWARDASIGTDELLRLMNVQVGTPEQIVASLNADPVFAPDGTHLIAAVQAESSTIGQAVERLEILAREIAPALGWSPATDRVAA